MIGTESPNSESATGSHLGGAQISMTGKKRVLVIDDDESLRFLNKSILEIDDYEVVTAKSSEEALALLSTIKVPDLILLDVQMEYMDGPQFLLKLEELQPSIIKTVPIIFLSAMDKVPETKASGFIRKPMEIDSFLATIRRFMIAGVRKSPIESLS